jgi:pyruvate dehydrogenase E1 component alpha subunit
MDEKALLAQMVLIRRFEEKCAELYSAGKIRGFLHLYIGEEAVGVGLLSALDAEDAVVSHYREHGHALARGVPAGPILAEMLGRANGVSRGRGGSMHLFDVGRRFYGGTAIVAAGIPLAVGLALADRLQGKRRVTLCIFGDGATAEGEFHESLNLAALWKLPVLFALENNGYAMGTAIARHQSQLDYGLKARGYGVPFASVDGMDVLAVARATADAVRYVKSGEGPFFLECRTYRFRAHSMFDAELYRTKAEVEEARKRDPIALSAARLGLGPPALRELERETDAGILAAVAFAEAGPLEPVADLGLDVVARRPA